MPASFRHHLFRDGDDESAPKGASHDLVRPAREENACDENIGVERNAQATLRHSVRGTAPRACALPLR
jgi:hypothetical protein